MTSSVPPTSVDSSGPRAPLPPLGTSARDRQLLRGAALGDTAAWAQLVDDHAQAVWDVARAAHLRPEEAGAVCEVVWMLLAGALPATDGLPVSVWLRRTATTESHLAYLRAHPSLAVGERRRQRRLSS